MKTGMLTLYGIANCDTIRRTRAWLADQQVPYSFHDYKKQGIDAALAGQMLLALPLNELINRRGTTWRNLPAEVQAAFTTDTAVALMLAQPSVIRRPILRRGDDWIVANDEEKLHAFIRTGTKN